MNRFGERWPGGKLFEIGLRERGHFSVHVCAISGLLCGSLWNPGFYLTAAN